jgi:membrane associated rhomboid family serine protease
MRRVATRLLIESVRLAFAVLVGYGVAKGLQGPIESTCNPSPIAENPTALCSGLSFVSGAILGFFGAIILSVIAELVWRRRRKRRFAN